MELVCFGQLKKAGISLILVLIFSGIQLDFKSYPVSSHFGITPAFATYGVDQRNNGGHTYVEYEVRAVLALTPKKAIKIYKYFVRHPKQIFKIKGFSSSLSRKILDSLNSDTEYTKGLIREMRKAKTTKKKIKILERHERKHKKEIEKLKKDQKSILKKRVYFSRPMTKLELARHNSNLRRIAAANDKLQMVKKWKKKLKKKAKKPTN